MEQTCHRCGVTLVPDGLFCPHCGAPQLRVEENESILAGQEGAIEQSLNRATEIMRWRSAITTALSIAAPVALLSTLSDLGAFFVFLGGFFTVYLYRRRTAAPTDGRIGWRIGGLMGVIAAIFWLAVEAFAMLFQRYAMHQGPAIDSTFQTSIKSAITTMNQENPSFQHQVPWFAHFWLSPAGIATLYLTGISIFALSMIFFSALGGALGGSSQRNRSQQSSSL
jgi:ribosomal protein L40E